MKAKILSLIGASLLFGGGVTALAGIAPQPPIATVDAGLLARVVVTAPALPD